MTQDTLYDRLGGCEGIRAVVDEFYDRLLRDDRLGPFFADADMEQLRRTQTEFLCEAAGGPETYEGPPVREAHSNVGLTREDVHRAVDLLARSLDEFDVPDEDADLVIEAIATYEDELVAGPDDE